MKAYSRMKSRFFCVFLIICVLLVGCNKSGVYLNRKMNSDLEQFYEKYLEITQVFEPLANMETKKIEAERQTVVASLNTEDSIKKQEEIKLIVNNLLDESETEYEIGFAESVAQSYKMIIEIKEDTIELDFVDIYIVVNTVRDEAKRHVK